MYCKNCGNEILEEFGTCPYCKTPIEPTQNSPKKQKWIPYYKRKDSIYQKYPIVSLITTVLMIVGGVCFLYNSIKLSKDWNQMPSSSPTTTYNYPTSTITTNTTLKNYQQIYNEYSQKLKDAGPTSSINEMANILNEGVTKMAQYMYSASGTDGQYATYQSWVDKLFTVYMNECR